MEMIWVSLVLGIVEGLTEFLPVSSTGHLIVAAAILGFEGDRAQVFEIFIQLGAILAVVWEFRARLWRVASRLRTSQQARGFTLRIALAVFPLAAVGLATHDVLREHLFHPRPVAIALLVGAALILAVESLPLTASTQDAESVTTRQAMLIGLAQCLALWPGFSRSAATILAGLICGLNRRSATEFSFFLAIPTMLAAGCYDLYRGHDALQAGDAGWLALTFGISFLVAWGAIRWLLHFVSNHGFRPFAWYRIVVGLAILLTLGR